jgi:hypothetical protein
MSGKLTPILNLHADSHESPSFPRPNGFHSPRMGFPAVTLSQWPNFLLQVASIGVSRMGGRTMRRMASQPKVKIVALCDVDAAHLKEVANGKGSSRAGGIGCPDASQHRD